jgi:hypothetical protein
MLPKGGVVRTSESIDFGEVTIQFTRVVEWMYDPSYGADADGNRGMATWMYDEEEPEDIVVVDEDGNETPIAQLSAERAKEVTAVIDKFLQATTPEGLNDDGPEEDYDGEPDDYDDDF